MRQHPAGKAGFSDAVKAAARRRSGNRCELGLPGCAVDAVQFHHRQLRRSGDHRIENCIHLCVECHGRVHRFVAPSLERGWLVSQYADPAEVPWECWRAGK